MPNVANVEILDDFDVVDGFATGLTGDSGRDDVDSTSERPTESTAAFYTLCLYTPSLQKSSSCQPAIPNVFGLARHIQDQDYPSVVLYHQTAIQLAPLVRPIAAQDWATNTLETRRAAFW
jgi:hypothetical protein